MDLSHAYDCLPHDLLIAKLRAYSLDRSSLKLLMDYLNSGKQRTKVNSSYSKWSEIKPGIPRTRTRVVQYIYKQLILCHRKV